MSNSENSSFENVSLENIQSLLEDMAKSNRENSSCLRDLTERVTSIEKSYEPGKTHKRKTEIIPANNSNQSKRLRHEIVVDVDKSCYPQAQEQTFVASANQPLTILDNGEEQIISYELPDVYNNGNTLHIVINQSYCFIYD